MVHRGDATARVTATGARSYFGRTAELVRTARSVGHLDRLLFAVEARALAREGVLVTGLSAVQEAATMDVLCVDGDVDFGSAVRVKPRSSPSSTRMNRCGVTTRQRRSSSMPWDNRRGSGSSVNERVAPKTQTSVSLIYRVSRR
jgi:hypothetical protein